MNVLTYEQLKQQLDAVVAECADLKTCAIGWAELYADEMGDPHITEDALPKTPNVTAALAEVEAKAALPANWDDLLFNEMNRRFELKRHDDDYLTNGDTQIGVEFAIEFIKQLREGRV
ncbi:hypothetical protein [Serratia fonticola]